MSQTLQGITFGFFENLPAEDKTQVEDILFGDKAQAAKPDLPWDDEDPEVSATSPIPVSGAVEREPTPDAPVEAPSPTTLQEPAPQPEVPVTTATNNEGPSVPLHPPPGVPGPVFHPHGLTMVPGIQPMYTAYMGMYPPPSQGMGSVPISLMQMVPPPPTAPLQHHPAHMAMPMNDSQIGVHQPDNNNMMDKESTKILGGKTYERRNKKKRPADYYQKLSQQGGPEPMGRPPGAQGGVYGMVPPQGQPMMATQPPMQYQNTGVHPVPPQYIAHHSSPSHMMPGTSPHASHERILIPTGSPGQHYHSGLPAVPMSSPFIPPGAPVQGPPPPQRLQGSHLYQEPLPIATQAPPVTSPPQECQPSDAMATAVQEGEASQRHDATDSSISGEIYSNSCRTEPEADASNISFGEVDDDMRNIAEEKNMFPWDQANNNVKKSPQPVKREEFPSTEGKVEMQDLSGGSDVKATQLSSAKDLTETSLADKLSNCHIEPAEVGQETCSQVSGATSDLPVANDDCAAAIPTPEKPELPPPSISITVQSPPMQVESPPLNNCENANDAVANAMPAAPPKPKTTSWAGLFRGTTTAEAATVIYNSTNAVGAPAENQVGKDSETAQEPVSITNDKGAKHLANLLKDYQLSYAPPSLQPRGLTNRGNWCYVNATLQSLLACAPLYNLLKTLPHSDKSSRGPSSTPIMDSIVEFVNQFSPMPSMKPVDKMTKGGKGNIKYDIQPGPTFEVQNIYKMLQLIKYDGFKTGRQEDAEEFLSCVLNGLHEEMSAAIKSLGEPATNNHNSEEITTNGEADLAMEEIPADEIVDDDWEQVGPKKRSVITRVANFDTSPISEIFRGQLRNILNRQGAKESATLQPFFTLQLDIQSEKIYTVQDALEALVSRETLQGVTCVKTNVEVDATRRSMLENLPPVLLLHLKCFVYDKNGGCQKVVKQVDFSNELEINKELLSQNSRMKYTQAQRKYKLFAVVKHIGVRAAGGHYTADVYYQSLGEWLHFDDNHVTTVSMPSVFKFRAPKIPYLLYYRRTDLS